MRDSSVKEGDEEKGKSNVFGTAEIEDLFKNHF